MRRLTLFWFAMLFVAAGCNGATSRVAELEKKVVALELQQAGLKAAADVLEIRLTTTEQIQNEDARAKSAVFLTGETGFQTIHTNLGMFLVSLQDLKPYADGYKAVFRLGNPLALDFEDVEMELSWGPKRPEGAVGQAYRDWRNKFKSSKQTVTRRVRAGSWNPVEIILSPATAADVGHIEVTSIKTDKVVMALK